MSNLFFAKPILNSPYDYPQCHWELEKQNYAAKYVIMNNKTSDVIQVLQTTQVGAN